IEDPVLGLKQAESPLILMESEGTEVRLAVLLCMVGRSLHGQAQGQRPCHQKGSPLHHEILVPVSALPQELPSSSEQIRTSKSQQKALLRVRTARLFRLSANTNTTSPLRTGTRNSTAFSKTRKSNSKEI